MIKGFTKGADGDRRAASFSLKMFDSLSSISDFSSPVNEREKKRGGLVFVHVCV